MALPPLAGAVHDAATWPLPTVVLTPVGADGVVYGVALAVAEVERPMALTATTEIA